MSRLTDLLTAGPHAIDGGLASELEARGLHLVHREAAGPTIEIR